MNRDRTFIRKLGGIGKKIKQRKYGENIFFIYKEISLMKELILKQSDEINHLKNFIDVEHYVEKSKKGSLEFVGFKFKDLLVQEDLKDEKKCRHFKKIRCG